MHVRDSAFGNAHRASLVKFQLRKFLLEYTRVSYELLLDDQEETMTDVCLIKMGQRDGRAAFQATELFLARHEFITDKQN